MKMEPREDTRPKRKMDMCTKIFMGAMGAALKDKKAKEEGKEGVKEEVKEEAAEDGAPPAKKAKANVASSMLNRLGMVTKEKKKRVKVTLKKKSEGEADAAS